MERELKAEMEGGSMSASNILIEMANLEKYRGTSSSSDSEYYEGGKKDKRAAEDEKILRVMTEEQMERILYADKIDVVEEYSCFCGCWKFDPKPLSIKEGKDGEMVQSYQS